MAEIKALSKKYKFKIIEDASHAIGGTYNSFKVGSCAFSDVTVFSFHPVKIITTAEGGMALTNCAEIAKRMRLFSSHGITRNAELFETKSENFWHYEQLELGYNYRMNELSAALGLSQSKKIDQFVEIRNKLADNYSREFKLTKLHLPNVPQNKISSFHLYIIRLPINVKEKEHRNFMEDLLSCGIGVNLHYMPVYNHPFYQNLGFKKNYCPEAEAYARTAVSYLYTQIYQMKIKKKLLIKQKRSGKIVMPTNIGLGSAQFGLDYGVSNHSGEVSKEEVKRILKTAQAAGSKFYRYRSWIWRGGTKIRCVQP